MRGTTNQIWSSNDTAQSMRPSHDLPLLISALLPRCQMCLITHLSACIHSQETPPDNTLGKCAPERPSRR